MVRVYKAQLAILRRPTQRRQQAIAAAQHIARQQQHTQAQLSAQRVRQMLAMVHVRKTQAQATAAQQAMALALATLHQQQAMVLAQHHHILVVQLAAQQAQQMPATEHVRKTLVQAMAQALHMLALMSQSMAATPHQAVTHRQQLTCLSASKPLTHKFKNPHRRMWVFFMPKNNRDN